MSHTDQQAPMNQSYQAYMSMTQAPADDEIDLRELFNVIWQGKWLIVIITLVFSVGAVFFALSQPNQYKSSVLLAPTSKDGQGGLGAMASQFGGLASLAGINLGGGGGDSTTLALEVVKSRQFIAEFVNRHDLKMAIMATESWNESDNSLHINPELYDQASQQWVRKVKPSKSIEPTDWEVYKSFIKLLSTSKDKESGLVTLSIEYFSPIMAKQWLDWIVVELNNEMRKRDLSETQRNIDYLTNQLEKTQLAGMQTVFYQLIEEQTKTLMIAEAQEEYIFKVVDPAVVPEEKSKPKRALIAVLGTLLGGMLGVMIVLIRHFASTKSEHASLKLTTGANSSSDRE